MKRSFRSNRTPKLLLSCTLILMLFSGIAYGQTEPELRGDKYFSDGYISTGSGYHGLTGRITRTVVDLTVPGSVGKYPLKVVRTMRNWVTNNHDNPSNPNWNEEAGCSATWVSNMNGYRVEIKDQTTAYTGQMGVYLYYPDGTADHVVATPNPGVYTFGAGDRVTVGGSWGAYTVTSLKLADGGVVTLAQAAPGVFFWGTTAVTDPYGLTTTYTSGTNDRTITDASGRWIKGIYGTNTITTSAGDSVTYTVDSTPPAGLHVLSVNPTKLLSATYADGTVATYEYLSNVHGVFPYRCFDVRASSPMRSVEYSFDQTHDHWKQVYQRNTLGLFSLLDERLPYSTTRISARSEYAAGYAYGLGVHETRGDGAVRSMIPRSAWNATNFTGNIDSETDFSGHTTSYTYGIPLEYNPSGGVTNTATDARGNVHKISYLLTKSPPGAALPNDIIKSPTKVVHGDGTSASIVYTDNNNPYYVSQYIDELGRATSYDRLPNGLISQINYPDGSNEGWTYNSFNQPLTHRLKNGNTESFQYDSTGLLLKHLLPTSPDAIDYTYYPAGHAWKDRLKTQSDGRGNLTTYEYDLAFVSGVQSATPCPGRGLVTKIINPDNTYKSFGYDIYGNKIWEENELRQRTSYAYDAFNRKTSVTDPLGRTTQIQYQHSGFSEDPLAHTANKPRAIISPSGRRKGMLYDADFNLITEISGETSADASSTSYTYDAVGNRNKMTDPAGRVTTYEYDNRDRQITIFAPLSRTTRMTYDAVNNLLTTTYPDNTGISKTYDSMNRLLTSTDEMQRVTSYLYYPSGKTQRITDPKLNTYEYVYDAADRVTIFKLTNSGQTGFDTEQTSYDSAGNIATFKNRSGSVKSLVYDPRNRETSYTWNDGVTPGKTTTYDAASHVTQTANSASTLAYTFDTAGQLTQEVQAVAGTTTRSVNYTYDTDGNRTSVKAQ